MISALRRAGARQRRGICESRRHGSSLISPSHSIYVSESDDPYFNLSLEDWLFRHKNPKEPLLLLYRDRPCVVIGRNQNPWKEVNLRASRERGISWIRRRSGGGTVYHDMGNTNYSIHLPRTTFDRHATAQIVLGAVRSLGVDANVNDRNDICVGKNKIGRFYVSGSAYKIVNNRAYHHGTMLIETKLDLLGDLLRVNKDSIDTKGVASVRSPVCNLQQYHEKVTHESFVDAVVNAFRHEYDIDDEIHVVDSQEDIVRDIEYIRQGMKELPSWEWAYGQTPEFTQNINQTFSWGDVKAEIWSKHGIILSCKFLTVGSFETDVAELLGMLSSGLENQRYGFLDGSLSNLPEDERLHDVLGWLRMEMGS